MVRKLDPGHIKKVANNIQAMGFSVPVLVGKGSRHENRVQPRGGLTVLTRS
jgi:hypothetical protein